MTRQRTYLSNHRRRALLIFAALAAGTTTIVAAAETAWPDYYRQVIEYLRSNEAAVPRPLPDVHPVRTAFNREAIIPPQCYTRTEGIHNPCYVCHQNSRVGRENVMNDGDLQLAYSFSDVGMINHWRNLFTDRSAAVAAISDADILAWVDTDNYSELAARLQAENFAGWVPDLRGLAEGAAAFDEHGFARDGSHWVAFNYKPLPSSFWPTNGSTDDVMIRLAAPFRSTPEGEYSADIYRANLAITEANVKGLTEITSLPVDERKVGADLNGDDELGTVTRITAVRRYVGAAQDWFIDTSLYPEGTEFLHTVRYLDIDAKGSVGASRRMKEVRYLRKVVAYRKPVYARHYQTETFAKEAGALPQYKFLGDLGLDNGIGWAVQGFIEDRRGRLRAATYEETLFCMGCHTSVGSTIDKTFSFPRKVDGAAGWGYINLRGMPDAPNRGETDGEFLRYFERVGGGGEFRSNPEMLERWFRADGSVDRDLVQAAPDIHTLITPSAERALALNKAYRVIVDEQSYIFGRDATITPPVNVYPEINNSTAPTLPPERFVEWDIRLDWPDAED